MSLARETSLCNSSPTTIMIFKLGADARREIFFIVKEGVNISPAIRLAPKPQLF